MLEDPLWIKGLGVVPKHRIEGSLRLVVISVYLLFGLCELGGASLGADRRAMLVDERSLPNCAIYVRRHERAIHNMPHTADTLVRLRTSEAGAQEFALERV